MRGVCDTHMHFYDGTYPVAPAAVLRPPDATVDDYRDVQAHLELDRVVAVQPTTYGLDNRCQLAALAQLGDAARAVVVVDSSTSRSELDDLTAVGARGARFHMLAGGAVGWEQLEPTAAAIAEHGWHIQLQLDGNELPGLVNRLLALPTDVVIDHVGRFMPPPLPDSKAFGSLLRLVDGGRCWVKLSAPYESSALPRPHADVGRLVERLVAHAPERLLWATNWPHPGQADPPSLDDIASWRSAWIPAEHRVMILVDNPATLYGFMPFEESP